MRAVWHRSGAISDCDDPASDDLAIAAICGVTTDPPWQDFVRLLRAEHDASHANIIFRRADLQQTVMTYDFAPEVLAAGDPGALYRPAEDPIPYYRLDPFRVHAIEDFTGGDDAHPFVARFLAPLRMRSLLIVRVVADNRLQAWLSLTHPQADALGREHRAGLARAARLFAPALALFGAWKEVSDQRDAYARVLRARATRVLRIDQTGRVIEPDPQTAAWIAEEPALTIDGGHLRATAAADRTRLEAALSGIVAGRAEEALLAIGGGDSQVIELLVYRVSEPYEPVWANATRAIVYVRAGGREALPSPQRMRTRFGLSRREAALALLLTRGLTTAQAAQDLGISELTARAYLRQIFGKTGVSRQADLIREIQASIAAVA